MQGKELRLGGLLHMETSNEMPRLLPRIIDWIMKKTRGKT